MFSGERHGLLATQTYVEYVGKHAPGGDSVDLHIPPDQEAQAFASQNGKPASPRRQENQPVTGELLTGWPPNGPAAGSVVPNEIFERAVCRPHSDWPGPEPFPMPKPGGGGSSGKVSLHGGAAAGDDIGVR